MTEPLRTYDLSVSPEGPVYGALLRAAAAVPADVLGVVWHSEGLAKTDRARAVLAALEPHLLAAEEVSAWPGARTYGWTATRYTYALSPESLDVLLRSAASIFDWVSPDLPEDAHFLRADGSTVLGSTAQEDDVWVELTDDEVAVWRAQAPPEVRDALRQHQSTYEADLLKALGELAGTFAGRLPAVVTANVENLLAEGRRDSAVEVTCAALVANRLSVARDEFARLRDLAVAVGVAAEQVERVRPLIGPDPKARDE